MITTVDSNGNVNAASYGTCVRVRHEPVCIAFTTTTAKDTCKNILATNEFVVNLASFDRKLLEKARVIGLPFAPGINEMQKAELTALASKIVKPPRIAECRRHFECRVEWTKQWFDSVMVLGKVVAASVDQGYVDNDDYVLLDKIKPVVDCGPAYGSGKFLGMQQIMDVEMVYEGPEVQAYEENLRSRVLRVAKEDSK